VVLKFNVNNLQNDFTTSIQKHSNLVKSLKNYLFIFFLMKLKNYFFEKLSFHFFNKIARPFFLLSFGTLSHFV